MKEYKNRLADSILTRKLASTGAVLIEGAKWCGKTTTAGQIAKSTLFMQDPAQKKQNIEMAEMDPSFLLSGETPRLIDEWQLAPKLWDAIRYEVDKRDEFGQFILTGSAVPGDLSEISHSGTGRISRMLMRPMSLYESGDSNGSVSLSALFSDNINVAGTNNLNLEQIAFLICRGGWPKAIGTEPDVALQLAINYFDAVVNDDISRVDGVRRNAEKTKRILRSYARSVASQAKISSITQDVYSNEDIEDLTNKKVTISSYISALKKIFVIEDSLAWNPNLRSKTAIQASDTRYFTDPSIGTAALGLGARDLLNDLETMGLFFENLCIRDLRIYTDALDGQVYHYRDRNNLECDAVVHLRNGSYGLIEIKLGGDKRIEEGVKTLNKLEENIDTTKMKSPAFKMILTAVGNYAYRRKDGILIVPLGSLRA
jgi:predicted AAA+ superfamily ATPase